MSRTTVLALAAAWVLVGAPALAQEALNGDAPAGCEWSGSDALTCTIDGVPHIVDPPFGFDHNTTAKARAGDPDAMEMLVDFYGGTKPPRNPPLFLEWARKAAAAGNSRAMYQLGKALFDGEGAPVDEAAGVKWIRQAAESGLPEAMAVLGYAYAVGRGVPVDAAESVRWSRAGADAGSPDAMKNLAVSYTNGFGVPKDLREASRWRRLAAQANHQAVVPDPYQSQLAYPIEAAAEGIEGRAILRCTLDDRLFMKNCSVESEQPEGFGFGAAALTLAPEIQMQPGLKPGAPVRLPMPFKLGSPPEARPTTDRCAAYVIAMERETTFSGLPKWWAEYWLARSKFLARQAGEPESLQRLDAQVDEASGRLAAGKDRGFFGMVGRCNLRG